jgi:hypothetical protein
VGSVAIRTAMCTEGACASRLCVGRTWSLRQLHDPANVTILLLFAVSWLIKKGNVQPASRVYIRERKLRMNTNLKLFSFCFAGLTLTASMVSSAPPAGMGGARVSSMPARSVPTMTSGGSGRFHNNFDHFHHRTFIFIDAFGFPFFPPFPYDGYYPYPYGYYLTRTGTVLMVTMDTTIMRDLLTDMAIDPAS